MPGLGDHQRSAGTEEPHRAFGGHGRRPNDRATTRSNAARSAGVGRAPRPARTTTSTRSPSPSRSTPARGSRRAAAGRRAARPRPSGNSSASTSPGARRRSRGRGSGPSNAPIARGQIDGVVELALDRAGAEQAERARVLEDLDQLVGSRPLRVRSGHRRTLASADQAGRSTTRRRGSSPSDAVAMPSISDAVSWTTLRSLRRHRLERLRTAGLEHLLGERPGELGERLAALRPVAGDVDVDPHAVPVGLALHHRAHELLDRVQRRALRPDEEPEVVAGDLDDDHVVVDHALGLGAEVEGVDQTLGELLGRLGLLLDRHVVLGRVHGAPLLLVARLAGSARLPRPTVVPAEPLPPPRRRRAPPRRRRFDEPPSSAVRALCDGRSPAAARCRPVPPPLPPPTVAAGARTRRAAAACAAGARPASPARSASPAPGSGPRCSPSRPRNPLFGSSSTSYSTSSSSTPSSSSAASSASAIVRPVVSTHSMVIALFDSARHVLAAPGRTRATRRSVSVVCASCCSGGASRRSSAAAARSPDSRGRPGSTSPWPARSCAGARFAPRRLAGAPASPAPLAPFAAAARVGSARRWRRPGAGTASASPRRARERRRVGVDALRRRWRRPSAAAAMRGLPWSGDLAHDELLLAEAPEVAHQEVEDEAGGELQGEEPERDRQDRRDHRHLLVHVRRVAPALAGLQEPGDDHEADEDEVGERVEEPAGDAGGVLREVHPEELLRVRAGPASGGCSRPCGACRAGPVQNAA